MKRSGTPAVLPLRRGQPHCRWRGYDRITAEAAQESAVTMDIKLFVCCHQPVGVPRHPLLAPLQVGAALAEEHFPGFLHDDTGDNISDKNRSYCELTGQYWAWKNVEADYYGFFHYRRYLYPNAEAKRPYIIERDPTLALLDRLGYDRFAELIQEYDLILPKGENMYVPVREHYAGAPFHHGRDLALAEQIVRERHPEMMAAAEEYLSGSICYFGNIYIMKRQLFQDYCAWLFPILEEFDRRADISSYSPQERRVDGYLAERLLGIYTWWRGSEIRCQEMPRVHWMEGTAYFKRVVLNFFYPPGTYRRAMIKRLWRSSP